MIIAENLIQRVHAVGGQIKARGDKLKLSGPEPLPSDLMSSLAEHKSEIIKALHDDAITEWLRKNRRHG